MTMPRMTAGITPAGEGEGRIAWTILGQTYRPKQHSDSCFTFEALFPEGTFVPPHIHARQDEFIYLLEGRFELFLDGQTRHAEPGALVRLPMGIAHGIYNKSGAPARALFWVTPSRSLYALFSRIHKVDNPAEVMRIAGEHEVEFLPPPA